MYRVVASRFSQVPFGMSANRHLSHHGKYEKGGGANGCSRCNIFDVDVWNILDCVAYLHR